MKFCEKFEKILEYIQVKRFLISLLIGVVITGYASEYAKTVSADISSSVVRFHVLANSDADYDQKLKLKIRDKVIEYLKDKLEDAKDVNETKAIIKKELNNIIEVAKKTEKEEGYNYDIKAVLGNFEFPTKVYGDTSFPAGKYDALRILIGSAQGKNWWCVLYPQLCFTDTTHGKLPMESKNKLKNVLTDDEYEIITANATKPTVKIKFKILELFGR